MLRTEVKEEAGSVRVLCSRSDIAAIDVTELQEGQVSNLYHDNQLTYAVNVSMQYVFEMLESQILLFARLCEVCLSIVCYLVVYIQSYPSPGQ